MLGNSKVAFVLRPIGHRYQLIGDAYIDIDDEFRETYVVQDFAIV
jgi:hypothetical protein